MVLALWRKYRSWQASTQDYAALLRFNKRCIACFAFTTGKTFAQTVAKAGYATDPRYALAA